jgi:iron complex outermembrane receptor protein
VFGDDVDANLDGSPDLVDDEGELTNDEDALLLIHYAQHDAIFYGVEAASTVALVRAPWGDFDGRVSLDYVRGRLSNGQNLPRVTPLRFGAGFDYRHNKWSGIIDAFHVFHQNDNATLETETDGYTLVDAALNYELQLDGNKYQVSLRGRNLLDEEARVHTSFLKDVAPLSGRAVIISLQASF